MSSSVYLGLGANLGDPVQQVIDARNRLAAIVGVTELNCSSLYLTSPVGYDNQADFVNCVVELKGEFKLRQLFENTQQIEFDLGRVRDPKNQNAARNIDIDLLLFGSHREQSVDLIVPHPRMHQRLFVLAPLLELTPALVIPGLDSVRELVASGDFADQQVLKLG